MFHENAYTFMNSLYNSFTNEATKLMRHSATDCATHKPATGPCPDLSHTKCQHKHMEIYHTAKPSILNGSRPHKKMNKQILDI